MDLKGKVALITGSTAGIGRAIAEALLNSGADVCVSARNQDEIEATVVELKRIARSRVAGKSCDVRSFEQVQELMSFVDTTFGGIDILVNNAGSGVFKTVEETSAEDFRAVLETNLDDILGIIRQHQPDVVIVDSMQTMYRPDIESAPGSVAGHSPFLIEGSWSVSDNA